MNEGEIMSNTPQVCNQSPPHPQTQHLEGRIFFLANAQTAAFVSTPRKKSHKPRTFVFVVIQATREDLGRKVLQPLSTTKMPLVTYSCSGPAPAMLGLQVLAKLQEANVSFGTADTPSLIATTEHPITGSTTSTSVSWVGCARSLSKLVPSLALWEGPLVESWVDAAASTLLPVLQSDDKGKMEAFKSVVEDFCSKIEAHLFQSNKTYLTDTFSAADICVAIWLAMTMEKCALTKVPQQAYRWVMTVLSAIQSYEAKAIGPLMSRLEEGTASPESKPVATAAASPASAPAAAAASASGEFADNAIIQKLTEFGLVHDTYSHVACMTAEELVSNVPLASAKETHTKNLLLKDKKHGLFLVTHATSTTFNTKQLGTLLNLQGKVNLRLADEATLDKHLKVKKGCVGPLCIVNDSSKEVTLVLDKALMGFDFVHSHPLRNDASVKLTPSVLNEYLAKAGIEPVVVDFVGSGDAAATAAAPAAAPAPAPKQSKGDSKPKQQAASSSGGKQQTNQNKKNAKKGDTLLALQWKKSENFPMWYSDVIVLSEMISYYDISGCYILRPWSYKIWDLIQQWFNVEILKLGVENSYFPLFVSQDRLEKEKDHVEGFAPEVAWVTKSGDGELAKPIAVRPTSETIMYPAFSDWIKSHRDLPLKLNQWSNVVRWEFKDPTPFLRSREFLWQEGHTAHATYEDADSMVMSALGLYKQVYQDLLCVPVIPGYKTKKEKFAGGHQTTTVEAYVPGSGRAIQGATSHNLGQNFGKMFDITFQDETGGSKTVWQTSWGLTTRTIGVMVMVHGDDKGLVMPPRVSPLQVVIVPIISKRLTLEQCEPYCKSILDDMIAQGLRARFDDRTMYNPGWKYNHWEQKGVPIRIEVGPSDMENKQARIVVRHDGEKTDLPIEGLGAALKIKLDEIQKNMFEKARALRDEHVVQVTEWKDFVPNLELNNLVLTPWCGPEHEDWEDWVKKTSKEESLKNRGEEGEDERTATSVAAKTLCIPFDQPELPAGTKCIASGMDATCWVLWGRSY